MTTVFSRRAGASLALAALAAAILPRGAGASARNANDAGSFVSTLAQDAIDQLSAPNLSEGERDARFRRLFADGFDVPLIARFVLGRYCQGCCSCCFLLERTLGCETLSY